MAKKTKSSMPTEWEHFDLLELERHSLREENAKIKLVTLQTAFEMAVKHANEFRTAMRAKYKMSTEDKVNTDTRKIERAK